MAENVVTQAKHGPPVVVVRFEIPQSDDLTVEERSARARRGYVLELVRDGSISEGRGAELLGISRGEMFDLMHAASVPHARYSADEVARERSVFEQHRS